MTADRAKALLREASAEELVIPGTEKSISVTKVSTNQLRELTTAALASPSFNYGFNSKIYSILSENVVDIETKNLNELELLWLVAKFASKEDKDAKVPTIEEITTKGEKITVKSSVPYYSKCVEWVEALKTIMDTEGTDEEKAGQFFLADLCRYVKYIGVGDESLPVTVESVSELPFEMIQDTIGMLENVKKCSRSLLADKSGDFDISLFF